MRVGGRAGRSFGRLMLWAGGFLPAAAILVSFLMLPVFWILHSGLQRFPRAHQETLREVVSDFCDVSSTNPMELQQNKSQGGSASIVLAIPDWQGYAFVAPPTLGQVREGLLKDFQAFLEDSDFSYFEAVPLQPQAGTQPDISLAKFKLIERTEELRLALYLLKEMLTGGDTPFVFAHDSSTRGFWGGVPLPQPPPDKWLVPADEQDNATEYLTRVLSKGDARRNDEKAIIDIEMVLALLSGTQLIGKRPSMMPQMTMYPWTDARAVSGDWRPALEALRQHAEAEGIADGVEGIDVLTAKAIIQDTGDAFPVEPFREPTERWRRVGPGQYALIEPIYTVEGTKYSEFPPQFAEGAYVRLPERTTGRFEDAIEIDLHLRKWIDSIPSRYRSMEDSFRELERQSRGFRNFEMFRPGNPEPTTRYGHPMPTFLRQSDVEQREFAIDQSWLIGLEKSLPDRCRMQAGQVAALGLPGFVRGLVEMLFDSREDYPDDGLMTVHRSLDSWPGPSDVLSVANPESGARLLVWLPSGNGEVRIMAGWGLAACALIAVAVSICSAVIWQAVRPLAAVARATTQTDAALGCSEEMLEELRRVRDDLGTDGSKEGEVPVDAFRNMLGTLISLLQERDEWQGTLLHSLKNDINACIMGLNKLPPDADSSRESVDRAAARIKRALQNVRSYQQAIASGSEPPALLDLNSVASTIVDDITDAGGRAVFRPSGQLHAEVRKTALRSALENLAWNAHIYGGAVTIKTRETDAGEAEIVIDDDGPGIEEDIEELFKPYRRGKLSDRKEAFGGAGLGLTIARRVVVDHGGKLVVKNRTAPDGNVEGVRAQVVIPLRQTAMK